MILNHKTNGTDLYIIDFTPKGTNDRQEVGVYAKNRLDASNYLILNHIWGKQHSVRISTTALLK